MRRNVRFGSLADLLANFSVMTAFRTPGYLEFYENDGRQRPKAAGRID